MFLYFINIHSYIVGGTGPMVLFSKAHIHPNTIGFQSWNILRIEGCSTCFKDGIRNDR